MIEARYHAKLNALVNRPDIAPYIAPGYEDLDMAAFCAAPGNFICWRPPGAVIFTRLAPGVFELHYLLPASMSGPQKLDAVRSALHTAFTVHRAETIAGKTPRDNRAARFMNRALGALPVGEGVLPSGRPFIGYILTRERWVGVLSEKLSEALSVA